MHLEQLSNQERTDKQIKKSQLQLCQQQQKLLLKNNIILFQSSMWNSVQEQNQHKEIRITGWQKGILMPKNYNTPQTSALYTKNARSANRRQFIERRRKIKKLNNFQNQQFPNQHNQNFKHEKFLGREYNTIKNDNFSSINRLKRHMQDIEKLKDRWQQESSCRQLTQKQDNLNLHKRSQPGLKSSGEKIQESSKNPPLSLVFLRQMKTSRQNIRRPASCVRENCKRSITLSERNNERSKTIHSRCRRPLSAASISKSKPKSNKLNININQIESNQMKSILRILWNRR